MTAPARPEVAILLSTYNGAHWLPQQLDSLRAQSFEDWILWARDDGSKDGCAAVLRDYARRDPRIHLLLDDAGHLGAQKSFFWLLEHAAPEAPYVMFCDQDDVWHADKIEATRKAMRAAEKRFPDAPLLVHTDMRLVDRNLGVLYASAKKHLKFKVLEGDFFARLLAQNVVTGCTMMINRRLADACAPLSDDALMHDWWIALIAAALGRIVYLRRATIDYRQHESNASGSAVRRRPLADGVLRVITRPAHFDKLMEGRFKQCVALEAHLSRFPAAPGSRLLSRFLADARRGRVRTALAAWRDGVLMQGVLRNFLFYFLLLRRPYLPASKTN
jgi:glycosyltransferase involved in cell wall biosynthesis